MKDTEQQLMKKIIAVAGTQPPPLVAATESSPPKLQTLIALGKSEPVEFDKLIELINRTKTLNDTKKDRNAIGGDVKIKHDVMQQVEVKHNKVRQRLAVLIHVWDAEKYLEEATKVDAVSDGRVAATPAEAAESEYVDDMVSTDTQELDF
eukprot:COSAG05_NODE_92_length_19835_cov_158.918271_13_plen_150_part_00